MKKQILPPRTGAAEPQSKNLGIGELTTKDAKNAKGNRIVSRKACPERGRRGGKGDKFGFVSFLRTLHCYRSKFAQLAQISRCVKSKRAGFKPAPTNPDSFFVSFAFFAVNIPFRIFFGCGFAALGSLRLNLLFLLVAASPRWALRGEKGCS